MSKKNGSPEPFEERLARLKTALQAQDLAEAPSLEECVWIGDKGLNNGTARRGFSYTIALPTESYVERIVKTQAELERRIRIDNSALHSALHGVEGSVMRKLGKRRPELPSADSLFRKQTDQLKQVAGSYGESATKVMEAYDKFTEYKDKEVTGVLYYAVNRLNGVLDQLDEKHKLRSEISETLRDLPYSDERHRELNYGHDALTRQVMELESTQGELEWTLGFKYEQQKSVSDIEELTGRIAHSYRATANRIWQFADDYNQKWELYQIAVKEVKSMERVSEALDGLNGVISDAVAEINYSMNRITDIYNSLGHENIVRLGQELRITLSEVDRRNSEAASRYRAIAEALLGERGKK